MKLFAQLTKVDEEKRLVYGVAAAEQADRSGEILDYASSKPHFEKWVADSLAASDGKSHGNLRAMHGNIAAGKLVGIEFDDVAKNFPVVAKIVDDNEWKKVLEGVYTGFSIGGAYHKKWADPTMKKEGGVSALQRYTAAPAELSLVDRPCIPDAKFFSVQKADGTTSEVEFKPALEEAAKIAPAEYQVEGTDEEVAKLATVMGENKLGMVFVLDAVAKALAAKQAQTEADEVGAEIAKRETSKTLAKGMYTVSQLAQVCAQLEQLCKSVAWEEAQEGDDNSMLPQMMHDLCQKACDSLQAMIAEETYEMTTSTGEAVGADEVAAPMQMMAKVDSFKPLLELVDSPPEAGRVAKSFAALKIVVDNLSTVFPVIETPSPEEVAKNDAAQMNKLVADAIDEVSKRYEEKLGKLEEKITKLESLPASPRAILKAVPKVADAGDIDKVTEVMTAPVLKSDGEVNDVATAIKKMHQSGGRAFAPLA